MGVDFVTVDLVTPNWDKVATCTYVHAYAYLSHTKKADSLHRAVGDF